MRLTARVFGVASLLGIVFGLIFARTAFSEPYAAWVAGRVPPSFLAFAIDHGIAATPAGVLARTIVGWTLRWWFVALWIPGITALLKRFPLHGDGWPRRLWPHALVGAAFVVVLPLFDNFLLIPLISLRLEPRVLIEYWTTHDLRPLLGYMWSFMLHRAALTYVALLALLHAVADHGRYKEDELQASRLEATLAAVELKSLRAQMQAELLFGALDDVARLARDAPRAADRLLNRLSDSLRLTLQHADAADATLADALELLAVHMDVARLRASGTAALDRVIDPAALDARVPHLLLASLVDGLRPVLAREALRVSARRQDQVLELEIGLADAVTEDALAQALDEVRRRLERFQLGRHRADLRREPRRALVIRLHASETPAPPGSLSMEAALAHPHRR